MYALQRDKYTFRRMVYVTQLVGVLRYVRLIIGTMYTCSYYLYFFANLWTVFFANAEGAALVEECCYNIIRHLISVQLTFYARPTSGVQRVYIIIFRPWPRIGTSAYKMIYVYS